MYISNKGTLSVTKEELIKIIKSNPDNEKPESKRMNETVIEMIKKYWGNFTPKQSNWILSKVKYIFKELKVKVNEKQVKVKDLFYCVVPQVVKGEDENNVNIEE